VSDEHSYLSAEYMAAVEAEPFGAPERKLALVNGDAHAPSTAASTMPGFVRAIELPEPKPTEWLVRDLWPSAMFGLLVGDGGAFKSSLAIHVAGAIAGGYAVFDQFPVVQRPVCILSAEDDADLVLTRLGAFITGHGWDPHVVLEHVHILACEGATLSDLRWKRHLAAEIERIQPGFIVFDPWAELLGGDENSNTDARPVIKYLRELAKSVGAALAVVHHAGKMSDGKRQLDRIRGASALPSAARVIFFCDYRPDGVAIENLKMTRAPRLDPFVIRREITTAPGNRLLWESARLTYTLAKDDAIDRTQRFVIEQILRWPVTLHDGRGPSGNQLRQLAKGVKGIRNEGIDEAVEQLRIDGAIGYTTGPQKAKNWFISDSAHAVVRQTRTTMGSGSATGLATTELIDARARHAIATSPAAAQMDLGRLGRSSEVES
jgi:hypothetical protein